MNNKIIFMHIPRTGGASLRHILNKKNIKVIKHNIKDTNYESLEDYLINNELTIHKTRYYKTPKTLSLKTILKLTPFDFHFFKNLTPNLHFANNTKKNAFVFTFVRNPWDRVVSAFFYLNNGGNNPRDEADRIQYLEKYKLNFKLFVKEAFKGKNILNQLHFRPQHKWICNKKGELLVNYIGKFENLEKDMKRIQNILSINFGEIPHKNKSNHQYYQAYYDDETKEIIHKAYKKDIELFKYDF